MASPLITEMVLKTLKESNPKKLFSYLYRLPHFGVGRRFTKVTWVYETNEQDGESEGPASFWTITRVKPDGVCKELVRGLYMLCLVRN